VQCGNSKCGWNKKLCIKNKSSKELLFFYLYLV
jgi:hypothetical protein